LPAGAAQRGLSHAHRRGLPALPLVGRLARGYNAARFGGTLAMLAGAGVPILKALQAAAETLGNRAMRADALDALVQVREGAPLASPGQQAPIPRAAGDVRAPGRADRPAAAMLQRAAAQLCRPRCSAARWRGHAA
jgi:general secretion pathway protein F